MAGGAEIGCDFLIHRARFEVAVVDVPGALDVEESIQTLLREGLMPVLEEALNAAFPTEKSLVIPRLELDLGTVAWDGMGNRLPRVFGRALKRALERPVPPEASPGTDTGAGDNVAEQLRPVLIAGRRAPFLPRLLASWERHRREITSFFHAHRHERILPRHAAALLKRPQLQQSAIWISPELGPFAAAFILLSVSRHDRLRALAPIPGQADTFERQLWEFSLAWLLGQRGSRDGRKGYLDQVIHRMAARDNLKYESLRQALVRLFSKSFHEQARELVGLLRELAPPLPSDSRRDEVPALQPSRELEGVLEGLFLSGNAEAVPAEFWSRWDGYSREITAFFHAHRHHRELPHHAAEHLGQPRLRQLVAWLSPSMGPLVSAFIAGAVAGHDTLRSRISISGQAAELERRLWAFTLAWLLGPGATSSGPAAYLFRIIDHLARQDRARGEALRSNLVAVFSTSNDQKHRELVEILTELELSTAPAGEVAQEKDEGLIPALERLLSGGGETGDLARVRQALGDPLLPRAGVLIRKLGRASGVRQRILRLFSHDQRLALVGAAGRDGQMVGAFVDDTLSRKAPLQEAAPPGCSDTGLAELVWELSLALLWAEQESRFNFKHYVSRLIAGMAARWNTAYGALVDTFFQIFQARGAEPGLAVLTELRGELPGDKGGDKATEEPVPSRDELLEAIVLAKPGAARRLKAFKEESPIGYQRWIRSLQRDEGRLRAVVQAFSPRELGRFLFDAVTAVSGSVSEQIQRIIQWIVSCRRGEHGGFGSRQLGLCQALLQADHQRLADLLAAEPEIENGAGEGVERDQILLARAELKRTGRQVWADWLATVARQGDNGIQALLAAYRRRVEKMDSLPRAGFRALMTREQAWNAPESRAMQWWVRKVLDQGDSRQLAWLWSAGSTPWGASRLAESCGADGAHGLLRSVDPQLAREILPVMEIIMLGLETHGTGTPVRALGKEIWAWILRSVHGSGGRWRGSGDAFLNDVVAWIRHHHGPKALGELVVGISANVRPAVQAQMMPVLEACHRAMEGLAPAEETPQAFEAPEPVHREEEEMESKVDEICTVEDAGLVILSPFLPRLFQRLGYVTAGKWMDADAADRAHGVLRYLAHSETGYQGHHPLVRVLCGSDGDGRPISGVRLTAEEITQADALLAAVVGHWTALGNTTVAGLRETFIDRFGELRLKDGAWHLTVERRAYDVLLDRLPWGLSPIRHPFMTSVLYVNWR